MKISKILVIVGSLFVLGLFFFPMWQITIGAPQYPDPLGMNIWINKIVGEEENDIQNIDLMNHYIGMDPIPKDMPEFKNFPIIVGIMVALGLIVGFIGRPKLYLAWLIIAIGLGVGGMYDFYQWEYKYGHNLDSHAAIQFTDENGEPLAYQPPLFGSKKILNFDATSYPAAGAYFLLLGMALVGAGFVIGVRENKKINSKTQTERGEEAEKSGRLQVSIQS